MDNKQTKFLTGNFTDFIIPPKGIIEKYSESLLDDRDFPNYAYGEMVFQAIEEFLKIYPELEGLYINKQRCLYQLSHQGFLKSFFTESNEEESAYLSLSYEFALAHPEIPVLAWYVAANIYSHAFTSIVTCNDIRKKAIALYKTMWEKLPGNKYVLDYYIKAIKSQISEGFTSDTEMEEYKNILQSLPVDKGKDTIISLCDSFLSLLYKEENPKKRKQYFNKIKKLYEKNRNIDQLTVFYDFALMDCLVKETHNHQIIKKYLQKLINKYSNLNDLLGSHYWEMNYERIKCDSLSKINYFINISEAVKQYPHFPDFITIHRNVLVNIVGFNGNTSYRDAALILLKEMMKNHPENNDFKIRYAQGLFFISDRCNYLEEKIVFLDEIKILYDKTHLPDVISYYCLGLQNIFKHERNKFPTDKIYMYFTIIESYYCQFQNNEMISEAYVVYLKILLWADMRQWNKNLEEGKNEYPKLDKDYLYYFNLLYSLAHKFHVNREIVESYLDITENIIGSIDDMEILNKIYDDVINFSKEYPNDPGDITYNCNEILTKLYRKFNVYEKKVNCLKEMKRIVANYYDEPCYWVTDLFEELYNESENPKEKEYYLQMYIDYCNENPWNTNIAWKYVCQINNILQKTDALNEKIRLFSIIADWTLHQPGNFYILEEYADSLLNMVYSTKNKPEYLCYKDAFILFKKKFRAVISYTDLCKNEKYKELFGNTENADK